MMSTVGEFEPQHLGDLIQRADHLPGQEHLMPTDRIYARISDFAVVPYG